MMSVLLAAGLLSGAIGAGSEAPSDQPEQVCYSAGCVAFAPLSQRDVAPYENAMRRPDIFVSELNGNVSVDAFYGFGEIRYSDFRVDRSNCEADSGPGSHAERYFVLRPETGRIGGCRQLTLVVLSSLKPANDALVALDVEILILSETTEANKTTMAARNVLKRLGPRDFR